MSVTDSTRAQSSGSGLIDAGRAATAGVLVMLVSGGAHAFAGGGLPQPTSLLALTALAVTLSWCLGHRGMSRRRGVLVLVLAQPALHLLLAMSGPGHGSTAVPAPEPMHHAGHMVHATAAAGGPTWVELLHLTPAMVSGHLAAMIVSALILGLPRRAARSFALRWRSMRAMLNAPAFVLARVPEAPSNDRGRVLRVLTSGPAPVRGPPLALASPHPGG